MDRIEAFLRLTRPEFLLGGAVLFWLGTRAAGGAVTAASYALGQALVTSIQLLAQYANEYFDRETDAHASNRTWFSGGSGVLPSGRLEPMVALTAAGAAAVVAVLLLLVAGLVDWRLGAVGLIALAASWWYSAPPLRLVSTGWGEPIAAFTVGALVPVTGALAIGGATDWRLLLSFVIPMVLVVWGMLLAVDAPDAVSDRATGKRTLWIRLGERAVAFHAWLCVSAIATVLLAAGWRPTSSTAWAAAAATSVLGIEHYFIRGEVTGNRAHLLTLSAVASVPLIAFALGVPVD